MAEFRELLELAKKIKDRKLQKMVLDTLNQANKKLSHPGFKYPAADFKTVPASTGFHHTQEKGLVEHTLSVTLLSISAADNLERVYKVKLDRDSLIAAALVHDIGKVWTTQKVGKNWMPTGCTLDHTMLGTAELYSKGFPEKVLHIVASHFGPNGPTPPQTVEALVFHTIDNLDATLGQQAQQAVSQEEILKMLGLG